MIFAAKEVCCENASSGSAEAGRLLGAAAILRRFNDRDSRNLHETVQQAAATSSAFINWFDRQPGWTHRWSEAVLYASFIKDWTTRAEEAAEAAIAAAAVEAAAVG